VREKVQAVLLKITARRTKADLEIVRREVVGECREGADKLLDRLAEIQEPPWGAEPVGTRQAGPGSRSGKSNGGGGSTGTGSNGNGRRRLF